MISDREAWAMFAAARLSYLGNESGCSRVADVLVKELNERFPDEDVTKLKAQNEELKKNVADLHLYIHTLEKQLYDLR